MRTALFRATAVLAWSILGCSWAAAAEIKIGFVSTERVLRESAPAVRSLKKLEREFESRLADLRVAGQGSRVRRVGPRDALGQAGQRRRYLRT